MREAWLPMFQQECQRLQCSGEHLFRLAPFGSILCGKQRGGTTMRVRTPVTKGALQCDQSSLAVEFLDVHKIPCEGSGKLLEIVEGGSSQNMSPPIMLESC